MTYSLDLTIDGLPKITSNANRNWRGRWAEGKKWKRIVEEALTYGRHIPPEPFKKVVLTLTRNSHGRMPDYDNLVSSFKHVCDALVISKVILDDSPDVIVVRNYFSGHAKPRRGCIRIQIQEVA